MTVGFLTMSYAGYAACLTLIRTSGRAMRCGFSYSRVRASGRFSKRSGLTSTLPGRDQAIAPHEAEEARAPPAQRRGSGTGECGSRCLGSSLRLSLPGRRTGEGAPRHQKVLGFGYAAGGYHRISSSRQSAHVCIPSGLDRVELRNRWTSLGSHPTSDDEALCSSR